MSRADRILALAVERGPLGVCQYDFDHPSRDRQPAIPQISKVISAAGLDLQRVPTVGGMVWYLPEFAPAELMRSGWGCGACGARHSSDWPSDTCGACHGGPLVRARVLAPRPQENAA